MSMFFKQMLIECLPNIGLHEMRSLICVVEMLFLLLTASRAVPKWNLVNFSSLLSNWLLATIDSAVSSYVHCNCLISCNWVTIWLKCLNSPVYLNFSLFRPHFSKRYFSSYRRLRCSSICIQEYYP